MFRWPFGRGRRVDRDAVWFDALNSVMIAAKLDPLTFDQIVPLTKHHTALDSIDLEQLTLEQRAAVRSYMHALRTITTCNVKLFTAIGASAQ